MERYQFEDLISDYIENKLPVAKRKEFEAFMEENLEAKKQIESIRSLLNSMKDLPEIKTSDNFMENLMKKVEFEKNRPSKNKYVNPNRMKTYFGFTPVYATAMSCLIVALVVVALQLMPTDKFNLISVPNNIKQNLLESESFERQAKLLLPILNESIKLFEAETNKNNPYPGFSKN